MKINKMNIRKRSKNGDIVSAIRVPDEYTECIDSAMKSNYIPCTIHIDFKTKECSYRFLVGDIAIPFEFDANGNKDFYINLRDEHRLCRVDDAFGSHHYEIEEISYTPKVA